MAHLLDIIKREGFKGYSKIYNNKTKEYKYTNEIVGLGFSTMVNGGMDVRFIKGDKEIVWGLSEYKKPPTLISPRPNIEVKRFVDINKIIYDDNLNEKTIVIKTLVGSDFQYSDNSMNICLKRESHEDIFKAMYDKTIIFKYDLTK